MTAPLDDAKAAVRRLVDELVWCYRRMVETTEMAHIADRDAQRSLESLLAAVDVALVTCDDIANTNQGAHYNDIHWVKKQATTALAQIAAMGEGKEWTHG
jgi:hypothetical protein